jgi:hypothetical protein
MTGFGNLRIHFTAIGYTIVSLFEEEASLLNYIASGQLKSP